MKKPPNIRFRELERQTLYHEIRIFIAGVEVTQDLRDTVSTSMQNRTAFSTAQFTLDNAGDKYVMTAANVAGTFGADPYARYDETAKKAIVNRKLGLSSQPTLADRERVVEQLFVDARAQASLQFDTLDPEAAGQDDSTKQKAVQSVVNSTMQALGPQFFKDDDTASETGRSVLAKVVAEFPSLALHEADDIVQRGIKSRNSPLAGQDVTTESFAPAKREANKYNPRDPDTNETLWTFDQGDIVINKHDPVVIFAHNPLTENDEWYRAYKGFINTVTESCDETTGASSITVSCYCIRNMMAQQRVAKNMAIAQLDPIFLYEKQPGFFNDLTGANTDGTSSAAIGLNLEDFVSKFVVGRTLSEINGKVPATPKGSKDKGQNANTPVPAVGWFTIGRVVRYPAAGGASAVNGNVNSAQGDASAARLADWHNITMFGESALPQAKPRDLHGGFLTGPEVTTAGQACFIGGNEDPWRGKLHMLLPRGGTNVDSLEQFAFDANPEQFQFTDRLSFIRQYTEALDYQFYTTPCGDLVLEFPMYDFAPEHFGSEWERLFTVRGHAISSTVTPEAETVPAAVVVTGSYGGTQIPADAQSEQFNNMVMRVAAYSKVVATRYGIGNVDLDTRIPWLDTPEKVAAYALLTYQKKLMDASRASFVAAHRPFWGVNRPVLLARRGRLGLSESVETTWELLGQVSSTVTIRAIRKVVDEKVPSTLAGQPDRIMRSYRFTLTGGQHAGLSYLVPDAQKAKPDKPAAKSAGQAATKTTTAPTSSGTTTTSTGASSTSSTSSTTSTSTSTTGTSTANQSVPEASVAEEQAAQASLPTEQVPTQPAQSAQTETKTPSPTIDVKKIKARSGIDLTGSGVESPATSVPVQDIQKAPSNVATKDGVPLRADDTTRDVLYQMALAVPEVTLIVTQSWADKRDAHVAGRQVSNSKHYLGQAIDLRSRDPLTGKSVFTPDQLNRMADVATTNGYNFIVETQESGPHIHVEKANGDTGRAWTAFNARADAANKQSTQTQSTPSG
jgi:hypothetical protein